MNVKPLFKVKDKVTIEDYLRMFGVDDYEKYLNPTNDCLDNPFTDEHIRDAIALIKYHLNLESDKVYILSDSGDTDGMTSASMIYMYLKRFRPKWEIKILLHEGKERGLGDDKLFKEIIEKKRDLLIIPDSGTNNRERARQVFENGTDILVLDHHEKNTDDDIDCGVLINNQYNGWDKNGSGCVVTHTFMRAFDTEMNTKYAMDKKYLNLVALSIISDSMNVASYQNRWYLENGLFGDFCIANPFLVAIMKKKIGEKDFTQKDIAFSIIPCINSICRSKNQKAKQNIVKAMIGLINPEDVIEECIKAHADQKKYVSDFIDDNIDNIDKDQELIIYATQDIKRSCSGLIAGKIKGLFDNKPTIIGKIKEGIMIGSLRSDIPLREELDKCPYVDWCMGHEGQAGIQIQEKNIPLVQEFFKDNDLIKDAPAPQISVVKSFTIKSLPLQEFAILDQYSTLYGKGLDQPLYHVKGIKIKGDDIRWLGKGGTFKFSINGIDFIHFFTTRKLKEQLGKDNLNIELIGTLGFNIWNNKVTPTVTIENIEIKDNSNVDFDDVF